MTRIYWPPPLVAGPHALPAATAHYLTRVLRLTPGAELSVFDGHGHVATAVLTEDGIVLAAPTFSAASQPTVTLAVALPKGERADWLVEKACELGVMTLQWLVCDRSVVTLASPSKQARFARLAAAASRQSGRTTVADIGAPMPLHAFIAGDTSPVRWLAQPGASPMPALAFTTAATVVVGPEGGLTQEELHALTAAGYAPVSLSRHVLRVETAAVAALARMLAPTT